MMIRVRGIGWMTDREYGCVRTGKRRGYGSGTNDGTVPKSEIFSYPVKNFGRFDALSRMTCSAVALALTDAGISYSPDGKQDIGIIGTSAQGSLRSDVDYFKDYLESGRTLSRGNLFIYTLPSSPMGEAAIHFGLQGPLLYAAAEHASFSAVLMTAEEMLLTRETGCMLAGISEEHAAVYLVLETLPAEKDSLRGLDAVKEIVQTVPDMTGMIDALSRLTDKKGMF